MDTAFSHMRRGVTRGRKVLPRLLIALLCGLAIPASATDDGVDWEMVTTTDPDTWSDELKEQIEAAGRDPEKIAERVRLSQQKESDGDKHVDGDGGDRRIDLDALRRRVSSAIQEGKITAEEGRRIMAEAREKLAEQAGDSDVEFDALGHRLRAAVERGDLSPEEARRIYSEIREREAAERDVETDLGALRRRLGAAVERGDITAEEARRIFAEASERAGDGGADDGDDRRREFQRQVIEEAMNTPIDEWSDELKAKIERLGWDLDEFTRGIGQRQVIRDALAVPVDEWSDELKGRIVAAGLDLDEIAAFVRERQEEGDVQALTDDGDDIDTAIEERTWGQIKLESSDR